MLFAFVTNSNYFKPPEALLSLSLVNFTSTIFTMKTEQIGWLDECKDLKVFIVIIIIRHWEPYTNFYMAEGRTSAKIF